MKKEDFLFNLAFSRKILPQCDTVFYHTDCFCRSKTGFPLQRVKCVWCGDKKPLEYLYNNIIFISPFKKPSKIKDSLKITSTNQILGRSSITFSIDTKNNVNTRFFYSLNLNYVFSMPLLHALHSRRARTYVEANHS